MTRQYSHNLTMGLGREHGHEQLPGIFNSSPSETNQRGFYDFWAEMMNAASWDQIRVAPRTAQ